MEKKLKQPLIFFISTILVTLLVVGILLACGVHKLKDKSYYFDMTASVVYDYDDGSKRIRFCARVSKDSYQVYGNQDEYTSAEYFMVVMPKEYYQLALSKGKSIDDRSLYAFSEAEVTENTLFLCYSTSLQEGMYRLTPSKAQCYAVSNQGEVYLYLKPVEQRVMAYELRVIVTDFKEENKDAYYTAQAFVKLTKTDGSVEYRFAKPKTSGFPSPDGSVS